MATSQLIFKVKEYKDINSKNTCEVFSVYAVESDGILSVKTKVFERDYGSQTESIEVYIYDFLQGRKEKREGIWVSTATH